MMAMVWKVATSRVGIVVIILAALFTWHKLDKSSAVHDAVTEYVAGQELDALRAERAALERKAKRWKVANERLQDRLAQAEQEAEDATREINEYERTTDAPDDCAVDRNVLDRLRAK